MKFNILTSLQDSSFTIIFYFNQTIEDHKSSFPDEVYNKLFSLDADKQSNSVHLAYEHSLFISHNLGDIEKNNVEGLRQKLYSSIQEAIKYKSKSIQVVLLLPENQRESKEWAIALGETPVMSSYVFNVHKTKPKPIHKIDEINYYTNLKDISANLEYGKNSAEANCITRDLVNEPPNVLTQVELANRAVELGKEFGFKVQVLHKEEIEKLKMGGLLAVNQGSLIPPTFSILSWEPENATNEKPLILVGKGVVFDTGGLSLKPTAGSMDSMKSDMAGAAAVIGTFISLAKNKIPRKVIGLIPATDNRPGQLAYTPNDVVTISDGTTVEVLNTDAEGRMILADALVYAKKYNPALVIDLATLTGSAVIAIGEIAIALFSTASDELTDEMLQSGNTTHERLVRFPLWDEYRSQLDSSIADMKNVGSRAAGAITAAKFLQHFTDYPWMHLDIAGPAFLSKSDNYRGKNGTGVGVRLLTDFINNHSSF